VTLKKLKKFVGWGRALSILLVGEGTMPANRTNFCLWERP